MPQEILTLKNRKLIICFVTLFISPNIVHGALFEQVDYDLIYNFLFEINSPADFRIDRWCTPEAISERFKERCSYSFSDAYNKDQFEFKKHFEIDENVSKKRAFFDTLNPNTNTKNTIATDSLIKIINKKDPLYKLQKKYFFSLPSLKKLLNFGAVCLNFHHQTKTWIAHYYDDDAAIFEIDFMSSLPYVKSKVGPPFAGMTSLQTGVTKKERKVASHLLHKHITQAATTTNPKITYGIVNENTYCYGTNQIDKSTDYHISLEGMGAHWKTVLYCPKQKIAFWLDPMGRGYQDYAYLKAKGYTVIDLSHKLGKFQTSNPHTFNTLAYDGSSFIKSFAYAFTLISFLKTDDLIMPVCLEKIAQNDINLTKTILKTVIKFFMKSYYTSDLKLKTYQEIREIDAHLMLMFTLNALALKIYQNEVYDCFTDKSNFMTFMDPTLIFQDQPLTKKTVKSRLKVQFDKLYCELQTHINNKLEKKHLQSVAFPKLTNQVIAYFSTTASQLLDEQINFKLTDTKKNPKITYNISHGNVFEDTIKSTDAATDYHIILNEKKGSWSTILYCPQQTVAFLIDPMQKTNENSNYLNNNGYQMINLSDTFDSFLKDHPEIGQSFSNDTGSNDTGSFVKAFAYAITLINFLKIDDETMSKCLEKVAQGDIKTVQIIMESILEKLMKGYSIDHASLMEEYPLLSNIHTKYMHFFRRQALRFALYPSEFISRLDYLPDTSSKNYILECQIQSKEKNKVLALTKQGTQATNRLKELNIEGYNHICKTHVNQVLIEQGVEPINFLTHADQKATYVKAIASKLLADQTNPALYNQKNEIFTYSITENGKFCHGTEHIDPSINYHVALEGHNNHWVTILYCPQQKVAFLIDRKGKTDTNYAYIKDQSYQVIDVLLNKDTPEKQQSDSSSFSKSFADAITLVAFLREDYEMQQVLNKLTALVIIKPLLRIIIKQFLKSLINNAYAQQQRQSIDLYEFSIKPISKRFIAPKTPPQTTDEKFKNNTYLWHQLLDLVFYNLRFYFKQFFSSKILSFTSSKTSN